MKPENASFNHSGEIAKEDGKSPGLSLAASLRVVKEAIKRQFIPRIMLGLPSKSERRRMELEQRGKAMVRKEIALDRPPSSAAVGYMFGVSLQKIGQLFDVNLQRSILDGFPDSRARHDAALIIKLARGLRRSFNRLPASADGNIETFQISLLFEKFEKDILQSGIRAVQLEPIRAVLDQVSLKFKAKSVWLSLEDAREVVVAMLSSALDVVRNLLEFPPSPPVVLEDDAISHLTRTVNLQRHYWSEAREALSVSSRRDQYSHAVDTMKELRYRPYFAETFRPDRDRSVPGHFFQAARRSLVGNRLGNAHAFASLATKYLHDPTLENLSAINRFLRTWRTSEEPVKKGSNGTARGEYLSRNLFSVPGTSPQSFFRDVVAPALMWAETNYQSLNSTHIDDLSKLVMGTRSALEALTVREMVSSLSFGRTSRSDEFEIVGRWNTERTPFTRRLIEMDALAKTLAGIRPPEPFVDRYQALDDSFFTFLTGRNGHVWGAAKHLQSNPERRSRTEGNFFTGICGWASTCAQRYQEAIPNISTREMIWLTEYDCDEGGQVPEEVARQFEKIQQERRVEPGSTASGVVVPETAEWLGERVVRHYGFVITVSEGRIVSSIMDHLPKAMYITSCDLGNPCPLLIELRDRLAEYFSSQPLPTRYEPKRSFVLTELVIASNDTRLYRRSFGTSAYEALDEQFEYNVISRFADYDRVECLAICRPESEAMKSHKRRGWNDTGSVYEDEHGTKFAILHRVVRPAQVLLGLADIGERV